MLITKLVNFTFHPMIFISPLIKKGDTKMVTTFKDLKNFYELIEADDDELSIVVIGKDGNINHPKSELLLDIIEDLTE